MTTVRNFYSWKLREGGMESLSQSGITFQLAGKR